MKRVLLSLITIGLLFSCSPQEALTPKIEIESIAIEQNDMTLVVGENATLTVKVLPENADDRTVLWRSSDESKVMVSSAGRVAALAIGQAVITAEAGKKTDFITITVKPKLDPSVTIGVSKVSAVSAILSGETNLEKKMSSDMTMGIMLSTNSGVLPSTSTKIEAREISAKEGYDASYSYTVNATGLNPNATYYFRSYVTQNGQDTYGETQEFTTKALESLLVTNDPTDIEATSAILNAKLDLTDVKYGSISYGFYWGTSEASQNSNLKGEVIEDNTFFAALTNLSHNTQYWYKAYVKLDNQSFYGEIKTFTTDVVPVESVSLDITEYTFITIGNTLTLKATVLPADATDKSIKWATDNQKVATVDENGLVKAVGNGTAIISVTSKDQEKTASCIITVAQRITSITLAPNSLTLNEGESLALTATIKPDNANDKSLMWSTSDESIATVDANGKVTAVSKGIASIYAKAQDGSSQEGYCSITVNRPVTAIEFEESSITLYRTYDNPSIVLTAKVIPETATNTNIDWTSSDSSIASVTSEGIVTGLKKGEVTITASAKDGSGISSSCKVEIKQYVTSMWIHTFDINIIVGDNYTLDAPQIQPEDANDKTYSWVSSKENIATVDKDGKITGVSKGKTQIKAVANDGSGITAECTVTVSNKCPDGAVYLGINSSEGYKLYWATCNLGANTPQEPGDYYAWGEVEPYYTSQEPLVWKAGKETGYTLDSYSWNNGSPNYGYTKYNTSSSNGPIVDNKTVLDPEDDAARVNLGGNWRMPTYDEVDKLFWECTMERTEINGVYGLLITDASKNSIFLPAAGYRMDLDLKSKGTEGYYWTAILNSKYPAAAYNVHFSPEHMEKGDGARRRGFSIRPVYE